MKILMPWKQTYNGLYVRLIYKKEIFVADIQFERPVFKVRRVDTKTQPQEIKWKYRIFDEDNIKIMFGFRMDNPIHRGEECSKDAAMKIVDDYLAKLGYKLLNEGDKLLTLI